MNLIYYNRLKLKRKDYWKYDRKSDKEDIWKL